LKDKNFKAKSGKMTWSRQQDNAYNTARRCGQVDTPSQRRMVSPK